MELSCCLAFRARLRGRERRARRWLADAAWDAATVDAARVCERIADCDDDLFCNGMETCVDAICGAGTPPCAEDEQCLEDSDECVTVDCVGDAADADSDGYDSEHCGGDDCDDADPNRYPGNSEICDPDNHDEDCDPRTFGIRDLDSDGEPDSLCCNGENCGTDCDDTRAGVNPRVPEVCGNGLDDDCDSMMDEEVLTDVFVDGDGDGWGDSSMPAQVCPGVGGYSPNSRTVMMRTRQSIRAQPESAEVRMRIVWNPR